MHLRPPSTSRSEESMFEEDLKLYRYFDEQGKKLTGYKYTGDVYWDYANIERDHYRETEEEKGMKGFPFSAIHLILDISLMERSGMGMNSGVAEEW